MKHHSGNSAVDLDHVTKQLLRKAITGCLEIQNYASPLITPSKYQMGVQFEHKLSALLHLTNDKPGCEELRTELERVDDLMFQLKYMCMACVLPTMEKIDITLKRYLAQHNKPDPQEVQGSIDTVEAFDGPILEFSTALANKTAKAKGEEDSNYEAASLLLEHETTSEGTFGEEGHDYDISKRSSHRAHDFDDDEQSLHQDSAEDSGQFDTILEEPTEKESGRGGDGEGSDAPAKVVHVSLTEALAVSQGTIDGLLDAFDGSGDTLDLIEASLRRDDKDIVEQQRHFDPETAAAESELDDSTCDVFINNDPSFHRDCLASDGGSMRDLMGRDATERQMALVQEEQKKFFDRLHHLFEVRKKVEQRMKKIDPGGKLKEIEITIHSGGIQNKDGTFKTEYQQRDVSGKIARTLGDIYAAAEQANSSFLELVFGAVEKVKGLDRFDAFLPPLKPLDRATEKSKSDYAHRRPGPPEAWLYDVLRATITCKTVKQLESLNKFLCKKAHIVQGKNRFVIPAFNGYSDLLYHVRIPHEFRKNVHFIAEIQVVHKDMVSTEKLLGLNVHRLYFRACFPGPEQSTANRLSGLAKLDSTGAVDQDFMNVLLQSEDADELSMFAELFHEKLECYDEALQLYSHLLGLEEKRVGKNHWKTASVHQNMGLVLGKRGEFEGATQKFEIALAIQEAVLGKAHPEVATTRSHLGHVMCLRKDGSIPLEEALEEHRISLSIRESCLGAEHLDVATSYQNIGLALGQLGDLGGSLASYRSALSILERALGLEHAGVASTHSMLGTVLCAQGRNDEARIEYEKALKIRTKSLGKNHLATADSHIEMANMECELGDYDTAELKYREAWRIRRNALGVDHPDCATALSNIGHVLSQKGDFAGALVVHRNALGIRDAILGKRHPDSLSSRRSIESAMLRQKEE